MEFFFRPESIALIGASKTPGKVGFTLWQRLKKWGKKAYAVNPQFGYQNVKDIPAAVDLAVVAVPASAVPGVVADCQAKKVKGIVVISSGFAELGSRGVRLESPGLPLLGPNCLGLASPRDNLDITFAKTEPPPGNIGLISQSGALSSYLFNWAKEEKLGFSKFVSLGNRLSLDENDFLEYFGSDSETKIIGLYLESFSHGERWLKLASRVSREKPVIVLFAGQTEAGRRASLSHTASLSPAAKFVAAAIAQSGCIQAKTITDFTNLLEVFSLAPRMSDNDLAIVTNAGGPAILATDTAASLNLDVGKPVDVLGDADARRFQAGFDRVIKDRHQDAFLIIITSQANTQPEATCRAIVRRFARLKKPVVVSLLGGRLSEAARQILRQSQIPTVDLPQDASQALAALLSFYRSGRHPVYPVRRHYQSKTKPSGTLPEGRFTWSQAGKLCQGYQIPLVKTVRLTAPNKPDHFRWPVVLKADPAASVHRTEDKAIFLNLSSASALRLAWRRFHQKFPVILCQEQVSEGHEVFISLKQEPGWPPLLTLGGGGVYAELYQDVDRVFLPVNAKIVGQVLARTRVGQILGGYRGGPNLTDPVVKLILNCCRLFEENPTLSELEINPVMVSEHSITVVDVKITVNFNLRRDSS